MGDQIRIYSSAGQGRGAESEAVVVDEGAGFIVLADASREPSHRAVAARVAETAANRIFARETHEEGADVLRSAFAAADTVARRALGGAAPRGGGVMLIAALFDGRRLHVGHVGVTRAYLLRAPSDSAPPLVSQSKYTPSILLQAGARLTCLTKDHSPVASLVERGELERDAAKEHPLRFHPSRSLGVEEPAQPELVEVSPALGDRVLVCSGATWGALDDAALAKLLHNAGSAQAACIALSRGTSQVSEGGSPSIAVLDFPKELQPAMGAPSDAKRAGADAKDSKKSPENALLDAVGRDLTALARQDKLDPIVGRDDEIRRLGQVLIQRRKANALLVGDAGVGKTCIVEGLARWISSPSAPRALRDKRLVELSIGALVAGTKFRGEFEERVQAVIRLATEDPSLILFIDEFHTIIGAGGTGDALDAANILKPALARGDLRLIGATTTQEYDRHLARDEALARRFELIRIEEPGRGETIAILEGLRVRFEDHHGVAVHDDALEAAVDMSIRYLPERKLPDKAVDLIDQACAQKVLGGLSQRPKDAPAAEEDDDHDQVTRKDIAKIISERCRVPLGLVLQGNRERLDALGRWLGERVLGQKAAIDRVATAIQKSYLGLREPTRPIASFLFVGPTGVGKTETARVLAEHIFGRPEALHRYDMSEYSEKHQIARLIGAPPGYVGHEEEGALTSAVRRRPSAVVLFDEIEKAHPDVLQLLLQILDDGSLTDSRGRRASFRETIIVMTSNLALDVGAGRVIGFHRGDAAANAPSGGDKDAELRKALQQHLRPELVGRIQAIVPFRSLDAEAATGIAEKILREVLGRLDAHGGAPVVPAEVRARILEQAGSLRFSARDLQRLVEAEIGRLVEG